MKKKLLSGLLIFVLLLLAACQAPIVSDDNGNAALENENPENIVPQNEDENTTAYVKQYAYPKDVAYTTFLSGAVSDSNPSATKLEPVYILPWQKTIEETQRELDSPLSIAMGEHTLQGKYLWSSIGIHDNYASHEYLTATGETFAVSAKTGKLTLWGTNPSSSDSEEVIDKEIIIEKAKAFVADFIDLDRYVVQYEWDENLKGHYVYFVKMLGEFETAERISVTYNRDGNFVLYSATMQDEFSDNLVWNMSKQTADAIAMAKAEDANLSVFEDKQYSKVEMSIRDCRLILTEEGQLAALYQIVVRTGKTGEHGGYIDGGHITEVLVFDTAGVTIPVVAQ